MPSEPLDLTPAATKPTAIAAPPAEPAAISTHRPLPRARWLAATSLWRSPDFVRLWAAATVSGFGSQVSALALPLIAALTLEASPGQMGLLTAAGTAPHLLIGLFAGVWVDRLPRRPILVATDLARAALLATIPLAALLDALSIELLYGVAFLAGALTIYFDVAALALVPAIVGRERLVEGNGRLQASDSIAQVGGPGLAGVLVSMLSAPFAVLIDAVSFVVSAALLAALRTPEPRPVPAEQRPQVWREIGEGLRVVKGDRMLRALAGCSATISLSGFAFLAVYVLYMTQDLGLGAAGVGVVFATGGGGALIGALVAAPLSRRWGMGPVMAGAVLAFGLTGMMVPLAVLAPRIALPMVVASEFLQWLTLLVYNVNAMSLRQAVTPDRLLGRVHATIRFIVGGVQPLGSLAGGLLGGLIGPPLTLAVAEGGMFLAFLWLLLSPVRTLRDAPTGLGKE